MSTFSFTPWSCLHATGHCWFDGIGIGIGIEDAAHQEWPINAYNHSFIAIKPDGVQRGIVGTIIQRFENRGFKLVAIKLTSPGKEHLEKHYADLKDKPFFPGLVSCMRPYPPPPHP